MLRCGEPMSAFLDALIGEAWWVAVTLRGGAVWRCLVFSLWTLVSREEGAVAPIFCRGRVVRGLR